MADLRGIDLFSGAGGSSWGARAAGITLRAAFDKWKLAAAVYSSNFPGTKFFDVSLEDVDPRKLVKELGPIDLILASPECTSHSPAKGNAPRSEKSRETAFQVVRFAEAFKPRWIVIENVVSMRRWRQYKTFVDELRALGYNIKEQVLDSSDFGVPQRRRRLFITCDLKQAPPQIKKAARKTRLAAEILRDEYNLRPLRTKNRAKATLDRAQRAIDVVGKNKPFLIVYYGSDHSGGWQRLERPLRTITTVDRFALVVPGPDGHHMRMLQVPELAAAMGFPKELKLDQGTRRDRVHLIGNAVCPPVMQSVVTQLTTSSPHGG
jgi:DNA (cytosine-5)-methyltransferase 1